METTIRAAARLDKWDESEVLLSDAALLKDKGQSLQLILYILYL